MRERELDPVLDQKPELRMSKRPGDNEEEHEPTKCASTPTQPQPSLASPQTVLADPKEEAEAEAEAEALARAAEAVVQSTTQTAPSSERDRNPDEKILEEIQCEEPVLDEEMRDERVPSPAQPPTVTIDPKMSPLSTSPSAPLSAPAPVATPPTQHLESEPKPKPQMSTSDEDDDVEQAKARAAEDVGQTTTSARMDQITDEQNLEEIHSEKSVVDGEKRDERATPSIVINDPKMSPLFTTPSTTSSTPAPVVASPTQDSETESVSDPEAEQQEYFEYDETEWNPMTLQGEQIWQQTWFRSPALSSTNVTDLSISMEQLVQQQDKMEEAEIVLKASQAAVQITTRLSSAPAPVRDVNN